MGAIRFPGRPGPLWRTPSALGLGCLRWLGLGWRASWTPLGYARAVPEEGGKKVYEITDEGRKYLAEHSTTVDDIFERIAKFVEGFTDTPMMELNQAFQRLARTTYKTATGHLGEKETLERLRDIIRRAADEVEAATKQTPDAPPPAE